MAAIDLDRVISLRQIYRTLYGTELSPDQAHPSKNRQVASFRAAYLRSLQGADAPQPIDFSDWDGFSLSLQDYRLILCHLLDDLNAFNTAFFAYLEDLGEHPLHIDLIIANPDVIDALDRLYPDFAQRFSAFFQKQMATHHFHYLIKVILLINQLAAYYHYQPEHYFNSAGLAALSHCSGDFKPFNSLALGENSVKAIDRLMQRVEAEPVDLESTSSALRQEIMLNSIALAHGPVCMSDEEEVVWDYLLKDIHLTHFRGSQKRFAMIEDGSPPPAEEVPVIDRVGPPRGFFTAQDLELLLAMYDEVYGAIDPGWRDYLARQIKIDLANPEARFFVLRNDLGAFMGIASLLPHPHIQNAWLLKTNYVPKPYRHSLKLGAIAVNRALSELPTGTRIIGSCALANPAMEFHIEGKNGFATAMIYEGDELSSSQELFQLDRRVPPPHDPNFYTSAYVSKNQALWPQAAIKSQVTSQSPVHSPDGTMVFFKVDASSTDDQNNSPALLALLRHYFEDEAYVLTRCFYERNSNSEPDITQMYGVFEKRNETIHPQTQAIQV